MPTPVFNVAAPDAGATKSVEPRVLAIKFGDGYSQEMADGINNIVETWSISFSNRTRTVIQAVDDMFESLGGHSPFQWTTPEGKTKKFKCPKWSPSYNHDTDCSLSATFVQHYGP
jgi:phage-related protein